MDTEALYRQLQQHLDRMPVGFPATASGVEIRILRKLFTPAEAEVALALSAIPEPAATIHKRLKSEHTLPDLTHALEDMNHKGLILGFPVKGEMRYGKLAFVIGMYERQLNRLTPDLERDSRQYMQEAFGTAFHTRKTTQMRTVPVHQAIAVDRAAATYDDVRAFVEASPGPFAKMPCICRKGKALLGEKCRQTAERENCLTIGVAARWAVDEGYGRAISRQEMLALLEQADRDGLVLQPENTRNPLFVCCCCGCCCGVITSAKQLPHPAEYFSSSFYAAADAALCQSCGACIPRCQMDAITAAADGTSQVDRTRCIGCGLCITTCPSGALRLEKNQAPKVPPDNTQALYMKILQERYGPWGMAKIGARKLLGMKI